MNNTNNHAIAARHLSRPGSTPHDMVDPTSSDDSERLEVISRLKTMLDDNSTDFAPIWAIPRISLERDSSLESSMAPGIELLKRMIKKSAFQKILAKNRLSVDAVFQVTENGRITALAGNFTHDLTTQTQLDPELDDDLKTLTEVAIVLHGAVTLDDRVSMTQWLRFHDHPIPSTAAETQRLVTLLELRLPKSPPLGNYWEMLSTVTQSPVTLSSTQRGQIRALTHHHTQGSGKLLDKLAKIAMGHQFSSINRASADDQLLILASDSIAASWAKSYINELDWYGASSDQPLSDLYLQQVVLTAVLMDLHPSIGEVQPRNHVAGFNLYATEHVEQTFSAVRSALEHHLIKHSGVSKETAPLASHLLLAGVAPEFLVKNLPPTLLLGTPQWVEFCRAVALVEFNAPGSSRLMTYTQINKLATIELADESLTTITNLLAVDPLLDWALLNDVITLDDVQSSHAGAVDTATSAYEKHLGRYAEVQTRLSEKFPTRRDIARRLLKITAPGCKFLEDEILYSRKTLAPRPGFSTSEPMSLVELLMSNELAYREWDVVKKASVYETYPFINNETHRLKPEFNQLFNQAYTHFSEAMITSFKLAMTTLPTLDRTRLLRGQISLFTVRPSVAIIPTPEIKISINPLSLLTHTLTELSKLGYKENQGDKDAATGRYGVVIGSYFEGKLYCYELFTLHGLCRENPALAELISGQGLLNQTPRTDFSGSLKRYGRPSAVYRLPTDIECYTHGVTPDIKPSSVGVIEKLAVLPAMAAHSTQQSRGSYQSFYGGEFNHLAAFIQKQRPIATHEELFKECWGQTKLERLKAEYDAVTDTIINIIVPFKSCIQDINSDDPDRQAEGWAFCTVEAAMTLLLVVGAVAKIVSIAAKTASLASKAASMAKVGAGLVNQLFNPLDGVPELIRGGVKLLKLNQSGNSALKNVTAQLHKLTGSAQSYDLIKAAERSEINVGHWRPLDSAAESLMIVATRHNDQWYALNRASQPWGAKLRNFDIISTLHLPKLHKLMPATYSRKVVRDALPLARTKIDDAIRVLQDKSLDYDSGMVLKLLLGDNTVQSRNKVLQHLKEVKSEIARITPENYRYDVTNYKNSDRKDVLASLNPELYKRWKAASPAQIKQQPFMTIYTHRFNNEFRVQGFSRSAVADALIHELFHGAPNTLDHAYALIPALERQGNYQRLDVKLLLNLASGNFSQKIALKTLIATDEKTLKEIYSLDRNIINKLNDIDKDTLNHLGLINKKILDKLDDLHTVARQKLSTLDEQAIKEFQAIDRTVFLKLDKAAAVDNADSFALATSLLSQLTTDKPVFLENVEGMKKAVERNSGSYVGWEVLVSLNPV